MKTKYKAEFREKVSERVGMWKNFLERVTFLVESFTTRQILIQNFYNASSFLN